MFFLRIGYGVGRSGAAFLLIFLSTIPFSFARPGQQGNGKRRVHAYHLDQPIELDGVLKEDAWLKMEPASDFIQQLPRDGEPSTEKTEVRIAYDEKHLYFGVICFDREPGKILVTQNRRDGELIDTDSFQILLDTFGDGQNAFVFATTPIGIEYDGQVSRAGQSGGTLSATRPGAARTSGTRVGRGPGGAQRGGASAFNLNWDGVWEVRAQTTERGWEAEFAIPFKSLRFSTSDKTLWGVNFMRNIRRKNEQSFWSPISRAFDLFRVSLAGELDGVEAKLHRSLQLIPYGLVGASQNFQKSKDAKAEKEFGLDLKYTVTSSLTLDATLNTDFAQVEVDEEQVNLTRFDLFFPEKRPFFLENSGTFDFGNPREIEVFFTRRIGIDRSGRQVPIVGGARLTGKIEKFNLGILNMQTESVGDTTPANNFTVARVRRELRNRSSIGAIAVGRHATGSLAGRGDHNHTLGLDANLGFGEHLTLFSFLAKSFTPARTGDDHAGRLLLHYDNGLLEARGGYSEVGNDFNPEVGYLRRAGYRKPEWAFYLSPRPKWGPVRRLYPHHTGEEFFDFSGRRESAFHHFDFRVEFNDGSGMGLARNFSFERIDKPFDLPNSGVTVASGRYSFAEWSMNYSSDPSAPLFVDTRFNVGDFYDGSLRALTLEGGFRKGSNFLVSTRYLRNQVKVTGGEFVSTLVGLRVNYSFTTKSYVQSFIQYNNLIHQVSGNFRFAYLMTSSTGLFVVYNTHLDTLARGFEESFGRRTLDRVFLVKFSYLFGM